MAAINFFKEDVRFTFSFQTKARRWLKSCALAEGYGITNLNYIFTSDESLLKINIEFLNHHTLTDIITFDNSETRRAIEGDVFISIPRVRENAAKFDEPFEKELFRVLLHGLLHLMGYKDKTERTKKVMRQKEEAYLSLLQR
jgi:probable rRNA maturation factor